MENVQPTTGVVASQSPRFHTVNQFVERFPAWSTGSVRWLIFRGRENGLEASGAIVRMGRRIRIDETRFFDWVREQSRAA